MKATAMKKSKEKGVCEVLCINAEKVGRVKKTMPKGETVFRLARTFKALGDPTRIKILRALSEEELCVCDLAFLLKTSISAVSHQLRLLRSLELVRFRKEGKIVYYSLNDEHVMRLFGEGLKHVEE